MYDKLIKNLRYDSASALQNCEFDFVHSWMLQAADAIEELQDKVKRAAWFYDSAELAEAMRELNEFLPDVSDPEWQKAHMEMGFYSPVGEVYKAIGLYDEPPESDGE